MITLANEHIFFKRMAKCDCTELAQRPRKSGTNEANHHFFNNPHTHTLTNKMQNNQGQDEIDYEVGQEQLDAVDRMLEELDMDEQFDRGNVFSSFPLPHLSLFPSISPAVDERRTRSLYVTSAKRQRPSSFN